MQNIDKIIESLCDQIDLWSNLLSPHELQINQIEPSDVLNYPIIRDKETVELTFGYVFDVLLTTIGRLYDITYAGSHLWPDREDEFTELYSQYRLHAKLPYLEERLEQKNEITASNIPTLAYQIAHYGSWAGTVEVSSDQIIDPASLYNHACRFRRYLAKQSILGETALALGTMIDDTWAGHLQQSINTLAYRDKRMLTEAYRRYLSSEYLFPWLMYSDAINPSRHYMRLFDLAGHEDISMNEIHEKTLEQQFDEFNTVSESRETVRRIINRISTALEQIGNHEDLVDQLIYGGGQWGSSSMVGTHNPVNTIPSEDDDFACREVLIAFARGIRGRCGLKEILRRVREHLIRCGNPDSIKGNPTRIVIIFTDAWDPIALNESIGDFNAHREDPNPILIIGALINNKHITPQMIT